MANRKGDTGARLYQDMRSLASVSPAGTKLPSERQLARDYQVCVGTVRRTLDRLAEKGLIEKQHGKGNFVSQLGKTKDKHKGVLLFADGWGGEYHVFYSQRLEGAIAEAERRGYSLKVHSLHPTHEKDRGNFLDLVRNPLVKGIFYPYDYPPVLRAIRREKPNVPIVSDLVPPAVSNSVSVLVDRFEMGRMAMDYLLDKNCGSIAAVISGPILKAGMAYALDTCNRSDLPTLDFIPCGNWDSVPNTYNTLKQQDHDGVIFTDDNFGKALLKMLALDDPSFTETHRAISYANTGNEDLGILGTVPRLELNPFRFGQIIISALVDLLENSSNENCSIMVKPTLNEDVTGYWNRASV